VRRGGVEKPPPHPGETIPAMIAAHGSIDAVVIARGRFCFLAGQSCLRRSTFAQGRGGEQIE